MSQFEPGKLVNLSRLTHRVVAPNAGMMTGPGTNTYLIGNNELAVIDPGPKIDSHIDAILAAAESLNGTIKWILCTHTHPDHSPATVALQEKTGAKLMVNMPPKARAKTNHSSQNTLGLMVKH